MNLIDMHIHTTLSDGELTPLEILESCKKNGVNTLSITDHNNILGIKEAVLNNPYPELNLITGIELDGKYTGGELHILGYGISLDNKDLNKITNDIMQDNINRIKKLVSLLYEYFNLTFKDQDLEVVFSKKGNIGRPEIAKLCVKYGYVENVEMAFKTLFKPLKGKFSNKLELSAKECIDYIKNAGGVVSLAHPITLKKSDDELYDYLKLLKSYGLDAVEVYHSSQSKEYSKKLIEFSNKLGLLQSGGSDYHGPIVKPSIEIGSGKNGNLHITDLSILSKLER